MLAIGIGARDSAVSDGIGHGPAGRTDCRDTQFDGRAGARCDDHGAMTLSDELLEPPEVCAICGRELWSDGLPPAQDGTAWICGDCDQARNFEALDL